MAGKGRAGTDGQAKTGDEAAPPSRAERRRLAREGAPVADREIVPTGFSAFRRKSRTASFRLAAGLFAFGLIVVLLSQTIPHDYGFLELGWLFTLSIYDLVLAMLGLSVAGAMAGSIWGFRSIALAFLGVLLPMLLFFDPAFVLIQQTPLGSGLFLVAPVAVIATGASLWLPDPWRQHAAALSAAIVGFSLSLFIGLDDLGVGIADFASGALFCGLWLIVAPGLLLRQFKGPWLVIPSRIVGSWLVVIGIVVMVSLYLPAKDAPPPPGTQDLGLQFPDGTTMPLPDDLESDLPAPPPADAEEE